MIAAPDGRHVFVSTGRGKTVVVIDTMTKLFGARGRRRIARGSNKTDPSIVFRDTAAVDDEKIITVGTLRAISLADATPLVWGGAVLAAPALLAAEKASAGGRRRCGECRSGRRTGCQ